MQVYFNTNKLTQISASYSNGKRTHSTSYFLYSIAIIILSSMNNIKAVLPSFIQLD